MFLLHRGVFIIRRAILVPRLEGAAVDGLNCAIDREDKINTSQLYISYLSPTSSALTKLVEFLQVIDSPLHAYHPDPLVVSQRLSCTQSSKA